MVCFLVVFPFSINYFPPPLPSPYSPSSGEFVCQVAGYYLFSVSALSEANKVFWLDVQVNGQHQFAIYGPSSHSHMVS